MIVACIGHWYMELLYVVPVVLMGGWLTLSSRLEKRRAAAAAPTAERTPLPA